LELELDGISKEDGKKDLAAAPETEKKTTERRVTFSCGRHEKLVTPVDGANRKPRQKKQVLNMKHEQQRLVTRPYAEPECAPRDTMFSLRADYIATKKTERIVLKTEKIEMLKRKRGESRRREELREKLSGTEFSFDPYKEKTMTRMRYRQDVYETYFERQASVAGSYSEGQLSTTELYFDRHSHVRRMRRKTLFA